MRFQILTADLVGALSRLKGVVARKTTLPVLGGVLIRASLDGGLTICGTDLDSTLSLRVTADVGEEGACVAPLGRLAAAVGKIEGDELEFRLEKGRLSCKGADMRFTMLVLAAEEFPPAPTVGADAVVLLPKAGAWARALGTVLPFMAVDEERFVLCGALISGEGGELRCVATDGRRLAVATVGMEMVPGMVEVILPSHAVRMGVCGDGGGVTRVRVDGSCIEMEAADWRLVTKRIEGNYPNWKQVVPPAEMSLRKITVNREKLMEAVVFAQTMVTERSSSVKLSAVAGKLTVSANGPDIGECSAELPATVKGPPVDVGYAPVFVLDVLRAITADEVTLGMADEMSPCRVEEPGTIAVLMPMRIS